MPDTVVGRVTYIADVDGKVAVAESYVIGGQMANAMEKGFNAKQSLQGSIKAISASFSKMGKDLVPVSTRAKDLRRDLVNIGNVVATTGEKFEMSGRKGALALTTLSDAAKDSRTHLGNLGNVTAELDARMEAVRQRMLSTSKTVKQFDGALITSSDGVTKFSNRNQNLANSFKVLGDRIRVTGRNTRASFAEFDKVDWKALSSGAKRVAADNDKLDKSFRRLGPGVRRFIFYAVLFTAIMPELAALSSAAAGGIVVLAAAVGVLVAGIAVGAIAFTGLLGDIEKLPEGVRGARAALDELKGTFTELRDAMTLASAGAFTTLFTNLQATFSALTPVISQFAAIAVGALSDVFAQLAPGTAGFAMLEQIIVTLGPLFQSLVGILAPLGSALGGIFLAAAPFIQQFGDYLTDLLTRFSEWVNSVAGQTAIAEWFEQAGVILAAVADLAGDLGLALAGIVTPEVVAGLVSFLGQLGGFLPAVVALLDIVAKLQLFGILGAIFDTLGPILISLSKPLGEFASILGGAIIEALNVVGPLLLTLLEALYPLLPVLGNLITTLLPPLAEAFTALIGAVMPLIPPLLSVVGTIVELLLPILGPLIKLIVQLAGAGVLQPLVMTFQLLAGVLEALSPILTIIATLVGALIETLVALISGDFSAIPEIWGDAWTVMTDAVKTMVDFVAPLVEGLALFIRDAFNKIGKIFTAIFTQIGTAWNGFWNGLSGVVKNVWNGILGFIEGGINGTVDLLNGLIKGINAVGGGLGIHMNLLPKVRIPRLAAGALVTSRMFAEIGERGPEMVVPLRRPLSQVDPAVRDVAAYAQGKSTGNNKSVVFNEGAIQVVTPARNPALVASMVVDRITEDALN